MTLRATLNLTVYTAIEELLQEHPDYPIRILCELGGISRSAYYKWGSHVNTEKEDFNEMLAKKIEQLHGEHPDMGYRRIRDTLDHDQGIQVNDKRILRICRKKKIQSIIKHRYNCCTRPAVDPAYIAENILNREFTAEHLNEKWVTDVTEFKYETGTDARAGKVYLSVILDLCDHKPVSYVLSEHNDNPLAYDTHTKADKFVYSHHSTDPYCGRLMNAFDVVRVHKFGNLDAKAAEDTDITKLPSFKVMQEFASQNEDVKRTLAKEREEAAKADFMDDMDEDWQTGLELDRQGRIKDTMSNIALIIRYDKNLQSIVFNQLKNCLDVVGKLPWSQVKKGWSDADMACAKLYFERVYGLWSPGKFKDAMLAVVSAERLYHPIREYLESLTWDGKERIDTLLIDYLGAEDTPYVRAVTRKTLSAAVARIFQPGIKFDSILVLNGPQGVGKSMFFAIIGKDWYSDSLSISDMKDKTAAEKLQGYWILELGELAGIKKVDVETVKSFVTRTDDKFRQSYGLNVESHPRTCIIVGSTNSEVGFLRDVTGNRRFWPVHVSGKAKFHVWELKEVDQVWAEAVEKYHKGEKLYLTGKEASEAYAAQ